MYPFGQSHMHHNHSQVFYCPEVASNRVLLFLIALRTYFLLVFAITLLFYRRILLFYLFILLASYLVLLNSIFNIFLLLKTLLTILLRHLLLLQPVFLAIKQLEGIPDILGVNPQFGLHWVNPVRLSLPLKTIVLQHLQQ